MANKPSFVPLTEEQRHELAQFATSGSGWYSLPRGSLPSAFPEALRKKLDSAILIVSGSASATTYLVFNSLRVDEKTKLIDQEPFGVAVSASVASTGAVFVHHGAWPSRSFAPPPDFWAAVASSGVGNYFLARPPSGLTHGSLDDLPFGTQGAWNAIIGHISSSSAG